jgi:pimeloyl-ACP methyl ester carboxylesterase
VGRLHLDLFGVGLPAVFVHGSFGWGLDTFPEQRALAGEYRIVLVDRRGFGGSRWAEAEGWPADMHDLATLLDEIGPAHLVGQSYGAVVVLLTAGLRPERVLSLIAIEPPAFEVASGDPDADRTIAALKPVFERAAELTTREFVHEWARAGGGTEEGIVAWTESLDELGWAAAEASRRERWPATRQFSTASWRRRAFRRSSPAARGSRRSWAAKAPAETTPPSVRSSPTRSEHA